MTSPSRMVSAAEGHHGSALGLDRAVHLGLYGRHEAGLDVQADDVVASTPHEAPGEVHVEVRQSGGKSREVSSVIARLWRMALGAARGVSAATPRRFSAESD